MVEGLVFLLRAVGGLLQPQRRHIVDLLGLGQLHHLFGLGRPVLVLLVPHRHFLFHRLGVHVLQHHRVSHVAAVAVQHLPHLPYFQEFLLLFGNVQDDVRPVFLPAAVGNLKAHPVLGYPVDRLGPFLAAQGLDLHLFAHHEDRVEAQAEVADDVPLLLRLLLKLLHEFAGAGEGHLVDVFPDLFLRHADARVGDADDLLFLVHRHRHLHVLPAVRVEHPELGDGVARVAYCFPQENILIGIQPSFDDRHDILRLNGYGAFFISDCHFSVYFLPCPRPAGFVLFPSNIVSPDISDCKKKLALAECEC